MSGPPKVPQLDAANADPLAETKYDFARDLIGYGRHPPNAEWPGGAKVAVSFVINYEEVRVRSTSTSHCLKESLVHAAAYREPSVLFKTATRHPKAVSTNKQAIALGVQASVLSTSSLIMSTARVSGSGGC